MSELAAKLLREVLSLPVQDRAQIAAALMASVDGEPDADAEAAWAAEIERREARAVAGESNGQSWDEALRRIEENLPPR